MKCMVCRGRGTVPGTYRRDQCPNCCGRDLHRPLYPNVPDEWEEMVMRMHSRLASASGESRTPAPKEPR
jgi:hypothetical protein